MTDRIRAALGPVDDLLDELDRELIEESLAAGQPEEEPAREVCRWCWHSWHGLACHPGPAFGRRTAFEDLVNTDEGLSQLDVWPLIADGPHADHWLCSCEGSLTSRDDSWRPNFSAHWDVQTRLSFRMAETGQDGYACRAESPTFGDLWDGMRTAFHRVWVQAVEPVVRAINTTTWAALPPVRRGVSADYVIYDESFEWSGASADSVNWPGSVETDDAYWQRFRDRLREHQRTWVRADPARYRRVEAAMTFGLDLGFDPGLAARLAETRDRQLREEAAAALPPPPEIPSDWREIRPGWSRPATEQPRPRRHGGGSRA